jgi:TetR/AcrR family transcriptional regulator, regulator of cefoperazone and chloramphenicol sensitivity
MAQAATHYRPGTSPRGEDTRRRILDAAIGVFAAEGYEGASTRMLAERAGVNLPAIQYYFGSKEGLYRAAMEDIALHIERHMAAPADEVRAALATGEPSQRRLFELLFGMLDAFLTLVVGWVRPELYSYFIARAEVERAAALGPLHQTFRRQVLDPTVALVGRLSKRPGAEEATLLRTLTILGQVLVFGKRGPLQAVGRDRLSDDQARCIRALLRQNTEAILRAARTHCDDAPPR